MGFFRRKKETAAPEQRVWGKVEYIICGLGNPGLEYERSRHNAGFMCIERLEEKYGFKTNSFKFRSMLCDTMINNVRCIVMRPQTYMNLSGEAVRAVADFYKIPDERVLVIFDDISLTMGSVRIRKKGSAGGHNGIKSIINNLGSEDFPRIKLGVGDRSDPDEDLKDHVLGSFTQDEMKLLEAAMEKACDAVGLIVSGKMDEALETCQINVK